MQAPPSAPAVASHAPAVRWAFRHAILRGLPRPTRPPAGTIPAGTIPAGTIFRSGVP